MTVLIREQKEQAVQDTVSSSPEEITALERSQRSPEASALLVFTDDLLDEIDSVLDGCEVLAQSYVQEGGE